MGFALASAVGAASHDRTSNTFVIDLSTELAEVIRPDNTAFLDRVGIGGLTAKQRTHYWAEDKLNPYTATATSDADGTLTSGEASFTCTSGQEGRFKKGTLIKDAAIGKTEVMRVTLVSSNTLSIDRGHGSTSGESHASGWTIQIIAHTKGEGWKPAQEDWTQERSSVYNYTQIFGFGITLARTRQYVDQHVISSELAHQSAYRLKEFARMLDGSLINGVRSSNVPSDSDYGSMGGILEYATQSSGNTNTSTEDLDENVINTMFKQIWDDAGGVERGFILVGGALKRVIAQFDQAYRRSEFDTRAAGFTVEKFLTDLGFELEVIVDPWMLDDVCIIGDLNKIKVGPLSNDSVSLEELAKTGRTLEYMVTGQYTAEIRNALESTAYHNNLS